MKIAIISPYQFRFARGIERFTWCLADAFSQCDIEVDILAWSWPNSVKWGDPPPGVRLRRTPYFRYHIDKLAIPFYFFWLRSNQYDWVILYFAGYGEAEAMTLLRRFHAQKYAIIFHFPHEQVPHRYAEFERYNLARNADQLFAVSDFVARGVRRIFTDQTCVVVPNGVDANVFQPSPEKRREIRRKFGIEDDVPVLVSLTALEERKGIQWVIRALPGLLQDHPNIRYWVLGDGDYRAELESEISRLELEAHISLLGRQSNVVPYLAAADMACLLSYGEAFPIALVEYMAMELPVLVSNHSPFPELVDPSFGKCVDEQNTQQVTDAIHNLLAHPENRRPMGQNGRFTVLQKYTWTHTAEQYLRALS